MAVRSSLELKRRIRSVQNTQQITRAMKMVAAAQLRKAEAQMRAMRPYTEFINQFLVEFLPMLSGIESPLILTRPVKSIGVVLISSDRGLCGAFNTHLFERFNAFCREHSGKEIKLFCCGKKVINKFKKLGLPVLKSYEDLFRKLSLSTSTSLVETFTRYYLDSTIDELYVISTTFATTFKQVVKVQQLLPLAIEKIIAAMPHLEERKEKRKLYEFEPSVPEFCDVILGKYLSRQLYSAFLESFASELAARMVAMDSATSNADDMLAELTLEFNKIRQDGITKEILEVAGAAEAMR